MTAWGGQRPVLAATDFSDDSAAALVWASRQAALAGARLTVLHVVHDPPEAAGFYLPEAGAASVPMMDAAREMMADHIAEMRQAHPELTALQSASTELVWGLPPGRIVEVATRDDAQMIVIGSRGRTGLGRILIGSVAERVAQLVPMPVVIIKGQGES